VSLRLLALGLVLAGSPDPAPGALSVTIDVRARAVAPGEPLRLTVVSPEPLVELTADLLERPVFLVRERALEGGGERWSGWGLIDLDARPGPVGVEVRGRTAAGRPVAGARTLTIAARKFPEERLAVESKYVEPPPEVEERLKRERVELDRVYAARRDVPPPAAPFEKPVPGAPTGVFGTRRFYNGEPRSPHPGLDLKAETGTVVHAAGQGRVSLAQELYFSGNTVIVDHGGGLFTVYAHLSAIEVEPGQALEAGAVLGRSGATGRVTGPHLHWGAKIGDLPFDPEALLDPRLFP